MDKVEKISDFLKATDFLKAIDVFKVKQMQTEKEAIVESAQMLAEEAAKQKEFEAQILKMQHLMQQQQQLQKSFMHGGNGSPQEAAEIAMHELARAIDAIYDWGQNAKDPLGNFLPDALASDVKEKYNRLKWLIVGIYSNGSFPRNGSSVGWNQQMAKGR